MDDAVGLIGGEGFIKHCGVADIGDDERNLFLVLLAQVFNTGFKALV